MKKKIITKILCAVTCVGWVFGLPVFAYADVVITEVMYDIEGPDTGREWIEIWNTGSSTVDISTWKLFEANTNHKITAVGGVNLPPQGFAIIADNPDKFKIDNPTFSGLLFDSTFSLNNIGEAIVLRDASGADSDTVSYSPTVGGAGDGTTLQQVRATPSGMGSWISALPTIGSPTTAVESFHPTDTSGDGSGSTATSTPDTTPGDTATSDETDAGGSDVYSSHSGQSIAITSRDSVELQVTSGRSRLGFVGAPLIFEAKIKSAKNVTSGALMGMWSMGDGTEVAGQTIRHVYQFPGDYIVILNAGLGNAMAVSKTKVKIIDPRVAMTLPDRGENGYIEISNLSDFELNIGGWIVETLEKRFIVGRDTIVAKHSSVKLPLRSMGISPFRDYVRLANPSGKIVVTSEIVPLDVSSLVPVSSILLPEGINESTLLEKLKNISYQRL